MIRGKSKAVALLREGRKRISKFCVGQLRAREEDWETWSRFLTGGVGV